MFRFIDDFFVLLDRNSMDADLVVRKTLRVFKQIFSFIEMTDELSVEACIRIFDLRPICAC